MFAFINEQQSISRMNTSTVDVNEQNMRHAYLQVRSASPLSDVLAAYVPAGLERCFLGQGALQYLVFRSIAE